MKEEYMTEKDAILILNETLKNTNALLLGMKLEFIKMRRNVYD